MNFIAHDIDSGMPTERLLEKYKDKGLTEKLLATYRLELNFIIDNPDVSDEAREEYVRNLNRTYEK